MTVWIMHLPLTEAEEQALKQRDYLPLPFKDIPNLLPLQNSWDFRRLLSAQNVDMPPESIERLHDRVWKIYTELRAEDVIIVPLKHKRVVAVAELSGGYHYDTESADEPHRISVKWQEKEIPFIKFRLHKALLESSDWSITEVKDASARAIVQASLPYKYNRFSGLKWIVLIYTAFQLIRVLMHK